MASNEMAGTDKDERQNRQLLQAALRDAVPPPSPEGCRRIIEDLATANRPSPAWTVPVAVAAAVLLAVGTALLLRGMVFDTGAVPVADALKKTSLRVLFPDAGGVRSSAVGEVLTVSGERTVLRLGPTTLGLPRGTALRLKAAEPARQVFRLEQGLAVFELNPVRRGECLLVEVGEVTVEVKGTVFWVSASPVVEVGVVRGHVAVRVRNDRFSLSAGEKLAVSTRTVVAAESGETRRAEFLLSTSVAAPEPPTPGIAGTEQPVDALLAPPDAPRIRQPLALADIPTVNEIREALLAGDYEKARSAIDRRLVRLPDDGQTLDLLATWHRRQRHYAEAVKVYEQMTRTAAPAEANHARYRRGVLLQENLHDHLAAVAAFEDYLRAPLALRPSSPEARLRLCTSLRALGRSSQCHRVLQQLISENPGTDAAAEAERLLAQP